jgi:hypothetical protein
MTLREHDQVTPEQRPGSPIAASELQRLAQRHLIMHFTGADA